MKSLLLLNDTSNELHVGSACISMRLRALGRTYGYNVATARYENGQYRVPEGTWDYVIVNAEGTLSRNTDRAKALIEQIKQVAAPMALVSADICHETAAALQNIPFRLVHYRRPHDPHQMLDAAVEYILPDLFYPVVQETAARLQKSCLAPKRHWVIGDSHNPNDFDALRTFASRVSVPTKPQSMIVEQIVDGSFQLPVTERVKNRFWFLSRNTLGSWRRRYAARTLSQWVAELNSAQGLITGRFHQTVAALALGRPVRFIESETNKIERLADLFPKHDLQPLTAMMHTEAVDDSNPSRIAPQFDFDRLFSHLGLELA